jgi:hypothetical protein
LEIGNDGKGYEILLSPHVTSTNGVYASREVQSLERVMGELSVEGIHPTSKKLSKSFRSPIKDSIEKS